MLEVEAGTTADALPAAGVVKSPAGVAEGDRRVEGAASFELVEATGPAAAAEAEFDSATLGAVSAEIFESPEEANESVAKVEKEPGEPGAALAFAGSANDPTERGAGRCGSAEAFVTAGFEELVATSSAGTFSPVSEVGGKESVRDATRGFPSERAVDSPLLFVVVGADATSGVFSWVPAVCDWVGIAASARLAEAAGLRCGRATVSSVKEPG